MEPVVTEQPTEFGLCHQILIPLSFPLFLCDLAASEVDWANRERARDRLDIRGDLRCFGMAIVLDSTALYE